MRVVLVNALCGGILGGFLSYLGYSYKTWQFWVVFGIVIIIMSNNLL